MRSLKNHEKVVAIAVGLVAAVIYGFIAYVSLSSSYADQVSRKWRDAGEECIRSLEKVCVKEKDVPRKVISSEECPLLYEDFSLFGVYECKEGKLYADIWVGRINYVVRDKEVVWVWER
ncbi:MAG: hypothetical protein JHC21_02015 [Thermocrinis sp.]|nr:hypothetical protein [Thermocrinis sp.]